MTKIRQVVIGDYTLVKLPYQDDFTKTVGLSTIDFYQFNLNSIFDPDDTGTGHQPLGSDQWAPFYQIYMVYAAKVQLTVCSIDTGRGRIGMVPYTTFGGVSDDDSPFENPRCYSKVINDHTGGFKNIVTFKKYYSVQKILGRKLQKDLDGGALVSAGPSTSPSQICQLGLFFENDAAVNSNYRVYIKIKYYCKLLDKVFLGKS